MKLLALRGRNLASLSGEFAVDFEAAPLAGAGLFAITGPTGAGKSTLLDALCLALYDRLPRLAQASRTEIGRTDSAEERLAGDDVRTILRHGAADGFAEVDFVGRDGTRYRARWEVRRARGRATGRLQAQSLSLIEINSGNALGGTKRETLEAIRDKVGLDYDQFRRSVLLAQNEFDAFLRARPAERSELLELMTGTALYSALSVAAHERCRDERAALDQLDAELQRVNVLDDEARAILAERAAGAEADITRLSAECDALGREAAWYATARDLAARTEAAQAGLAAAQAERSAARPGQALLDETRLALSAAPLVAEVARLDAERARLADEDKAAAQGLADSHAARERQRLARDEAAGAHERAEADFRAAGPVLDQAAELDAHILDRLPRLAAGQAGVEAASEQVRQAQAMVAALETDAAAAADQVAAIEDWQERNQDRRILADQLDRWLELIAAQALAAAEAQRAGAAITTHAARIAALETDIAAAQARDPAIESALAEIETGRARLAATLASGDPGTLDRQRDALARRAAQLRGLETTAQSARTLAGREADLRDRQSGATRRRDEATAETARIDTARLGLDAALPEARRAFDLAAAAEGEEAARLRDRLITGQPCPVCGSTEHPLGNVRTGLTDLLDAHRSRVAELEAARDDLVQRRAAAQATLVSADETLSAVALDRAAIDTERQEVSRRWAAGVAELALDLSADPTAVGALEGLASALAACEAAEAALVVTLRDIRAAEAEMRRLGEERDRLRDERHSLYDSATEAKTALIEAKAGRDRAEADQQRAEDELARGRAVLAVPLSLVADWPQRLTDEAEALGAECRALAEEWGAKGRALDSARDTARALASKIDSATMARANADLALANAQRGLSDEQAGLDRLRTARAALFAGRDTASVRAGFETTRTARQAEHHAARDAWAAADRACGIAEERCRVLADALAATGQAHLAAVAAQDAHLAEIGLEVNAVVAALERGEAWVAAEESRQAALRDQETIAVAVLAERRVAQEAHLATRPARDEAEGAALLPGIQSALETARESLGQIRARLAEDDRNRDAATQTRERIAAQRRQFDLWRGMADLIGSADGRKFRQFAQGMTLDRLLHLANGHLSGLTPRYALQRAPGGDLDLQVVDRDMADEVRGVASLSGGERFLASLSLALGLASMSGSRTLAESLFIDEGFGALDAESLDVAISALETLHASGRTVGVISHVQPMIERIGVQIRVTKHGGGRSSIEVRASG